MLCAAWLARGTLLLVYASIVFSIVLLPVVEWVQQLSIFGHHPSRGLAILLLLAVAVAAFSILLVFVVPRIAADLEHLGGNLPDSMQELRDRVRQWPFGDTLASWIGSGSMQSHIAALAQQSWRSLSQIFSGLTSLMLMAILTAYLMLDGARSFRWWCSLLPAETERWLPQALHKGAERMQRWLRGQALLMIILGSASLVVFWALGLSYFYLLALFAGLANFVPILGPIATLIVAGGVALLDSGMKLLGVVIFYLIYQQVENAYLTPRIMKASVQLSGAAVVVALAIGGALGGILGAMVAVPSAALVVTVAGEARDRRQRGPACGERKAA